MNDSIGRIAVLGAGYMGSAITFPLSESGTEVSLWGTWLDDEIISICRSGQPHPRLKRKLNSTVRLFYSDDIKGVLEGIDLAVIAVSSEGFKPVFDLFLKNISEPVPVIALTKGFVKRNGEVLRISEYAEIEFKKRFGIHEHFYWGSVGGPVKAVELANRVVTFTIIGTGDDRICRIFKSFENSYYRISCTDDTAGVELSSALKNVYAIACGITDGYYGEKQADQYHNFKSAVYMQSLEEMGYVVEKLGGDKKTVVGLAGAGDLFVTAASGRNRVYGERVGRGEDSEEAFNAMLQDNRLAEGYNSLKLARLLFKRYEIDVEKNMPLFNVLYQIIFNDRIYNGQLEKIFRKLNIGSIL